MSMPTHLVAAGGYVEDKNGNLLLVKTFHRGWEPPDGQIENGESIEEGLLREIFEESGITATVRSLVGVYSNVGAQIGYDGKTPVPTKVLLDFICDYVGGELTSSDETSDVKWIPKSEVMDYVTSPIMRFRFEKALAFDGTVSYSSFVMQPEFEVKSDREV